MATESVRLGIIWDRLISITDEIFTSFVRVSFSTLVREAFDAVSVILDDRSRLLAQCSYGPPSFVGTVSNTARYMLNEFPVETLEPGDVLATNDPWMGTGQVNDLTSITPIFRKGTIVGYVGLVHHLPDIGGRLWSAVARDVYEEGLRLPPFKLVRAGKMNGEIANLIRSNVRFPAQVLGDVKAAIAAGHYGETVVSRLMDDYDLRRLPSDEIILKSKTAMRAKLAEIPRGTYSNVIKLEGWGEDDVTIRCRVRMKGGRAAVDYSGTSDSVDRGINVPMVYTRSFSAFALKAFAAPGIPNNEGNLSLIEVTAPDGCILNAEPPAAVGSRHVTGHFTVSAVYGALVKVMPARAVAESGMLSAIQFAGTDAKRERFGIVWFSAGGQGARSDKDGVDTLFMPTNLQDVPVEVFESEARGLVIEKRELIPDSGGPGRHRGGLGSEIVFRSMLKEPVVFSLFLSRTRWPPAGYLGGMPGAERGICMDGKEELHPRGQYELRTNGRLVLRDAGGGGFYPPRSRDDDETRRDVEEGFVTRAAARKYYRFKG